ncbi:hypothetical protein [Streptomyces subrutilus]|uniref:PASTA domain-containing protein n=1 Tax=Streptomyces subrutilus TaxID=36818 RepID=A0A1E5PYE7_9ACTN|nr:hypothetical protein [Streptomyces subrutilus]OEJ34470.1 hypothetical protein BGK67_26845 [Streptomyces subrutilus]
MRTHRTIAVLAFAGGLALTGCQETRDPAGGAPAASATASAPSTAPGASAPGTAILPDLVGKGLQAAQDEAQAAGFRTLKSHDALGRGRLQAMDRNWKVCSQEPRGGAAVSTDTSVDFGAVKLEEACPAQDASAPPAAGGSMPDLAGKSVKVARGALPPNTGISVKDSAQGRMVLQESNWKVCTQSPAAGTPLAGQPVAFTAVKFEEACP